MDEATAVFFFSNKSLMYKTQASVLNHSYQIFIWIKQKFQYFLSSPQTVWVISLQRKVRCFYTERLHNALFQCRLCNVPSCRSHTTGNAIQRKVQTLMISYSNFIFCLIEKYRLPVFSWITHHILSVKMTHYCSIYFYPISRKFYNTGITFWADNDMLLVFAWDLCKFICLIDTVAPCSSVHLLSRLTASVPFSFINCSCCLDSFVHYLGTVHTKNISLLAFLASSVTKTLVAVHTKSFHR